MICINKMLRTCSHFKAMGKEYSVKENIRICISVSSK